MTTEPFMPIAELREDTKIETTWGVFKDYQRQVAERDRKIADLLMEIDALKAEVARMIESTARALYPQSKFARK